MTDRQLKTWQREAAVVVGSRGTTGVLADARMLTFLSLPAPALLPVHRDEGRS